MNRVFTVTTGHRAGFHCDKAFTNKTTRICEHVLAVAEKEGTLEEFLNWFKRGRHAANLEKMTMDLGKKQIGKKKSTRKRSNTVKVPVTQIIDILEQNSSTTKNKVPQLNMTEMLNLSQMSGVIPFS